MLIYINHISRVLIVLFFTMVLNWVLTITFLDFQAPLPPKSPLTSADKDVITSSLCGCTVNVICIG